MITVPAYFNDSQRQATELRSNCWDYPADQRTHVCFSSYGFDKKNNETIAVFDLGGGTFDVSILEVGDGVFEVLATSGDTHLGGDDFEKIVDSLLKNSEGQKAVTCVKTNNATSGGSSRKGNQRLNCLALPKRKCYRLLPPPRTVLSAPGYDADTRQVEELCSNVYRIPGRNALRDAKLDKGAISRNSLGLVVPFQRYTSWSSGCW